MLLPSSSWNNASISATRLASSSDKTPSSFDRPITSSYSRSNLSFSSGVISTLFGVDWSTLLSSLGGVLCVLSLGIGVGSDSAFFGSVVPSVSVLLSSVACSSTSFGTLRFLFAARPACCPIFSNEKTPSKNACDKPSFHCLPVRTFSMIVEETSCKPSSLIFKP